MTKKQFEQSSVAAGIVVAIVAGVYGVVAFVDSRVERRLTEDDTLRKIASFVRPSCIFDERGSILYDSGAMQSIEEIKLEGLPKEEGKDRFPLPVKIILRPKTFLREAPILSSLDAYVLGVKAERGEKFDWVYTVFYNAAGEADFKKCRFRLELLQ